METKIKKNYYFILAAVFMMLYPIINVIRTIDLEFLFSFPTVVKLVIMFVIGCVLLTKKNNIVIAVLLGICSIINAYWLITSLGDVIFMTLANLSALITSVLLLVFSLLSTNKRNSNVMKLWLLPAVFSVCELLFSWLAYQTYYGIIFTMFENYLLYLMVLGIIKIFGMVFMALSFKEFSRMLPDTEEPEYQGQAKEKENGYCDMTKHVLLLVFIGWIWQYIWIYKTTDYLNKTPNEEKRDPATKLLLCMFVPFYYIYWIYQSARRIEILAKEKNIDSDIVTLSVVLSLFVGIVPPIIMQSKLNQICKCEEKTTTSTETNTVEQKVEINSDKTEEIRNYKKLLDDGIITEEEFEAKKKQLL